MRPFRETEKERPRRFWPGPSDVQKPVLFLLDSPGTVKKMAKVE